MSWLKRREEPISFRELQSLFSSDETLIALRWRLVNALRDGSMDLENETLKDHLRQTVVNQLAIDQPKYSGFKTAINYAP